MIQVPEFSTDLSSSTLTARFKSCGVGYNTPVSAVSGPPARRKILIVDDDIGGSQVHARWLRLEGFAVDLAATAEIGLRQAQLSRPDGIIVDLHMPLADGIVFLRRLRARDDLRTIPVAIATGDLFLDDGVASEIKTLGAQVSYKPLFAEHIVKLARSLVEVLH
jgi:CheY-like chemotaxis protein